MSRTALSGHIGSGPGHISNGPDEIRSGSVEEFAALLAAAGMTPNDLAAQFRHLDLADFAKFIDYLRVAVFTGTPTVSRLRFHLELLTTVPRSRYHDWKLLLQELHHRAHLSPKTEEFVRGEHVAEFLYRLLLEKLGIEPHVAPEQRENQHAFLKATITALEQMPQLAAEDPNIPLLFQLVNKYGSLANYYREDPVPRRAVQRLAELGFNVEHLVFAHDEVSSLGQTDAQVVETWSNALIEIVRMTVGNQDRAPLVDLGVDRFKLFHEIKADYNDVLESQSVAAGLRLIEHLLPKLQACTAARSRAGDVAGHDATVNIVRRLQYIRRALINGDDAPPAPARLRAIRSPKLLPEILFDNTRLACCLFKPNGLFHGEISRLLLDPATPLMELWSDPTPEFLGLAGVYPGTNKDGRRTILIDTVDHDDRLCDLVGLRATMRFMLNAMCLDAYRSGAEVLLIFAAPYGKPLGFANFVKEVTAKSDAVAFKESYYFEAAVADDAALEPSLTGKHHYTVAYGYDVPVMGVMDYGYNMVQYPSVTKYYEGGRGVFEIDVARFLDEIKVAKPNLETERGSGEGLDLALHRAPEAHDEEIARRERVVLGAGLERLREKITRPSIELVSRLDDALYTEIASLERGAFEEALRYDRQQIEVRLEQKAGQLLIVRADHTLAGLMLSYVSPVIQPSGMMYLDDLAVAPAHQSKGLGSLMLDVLARLAGVRGYRGIYALTQSGARSGKLIEFYTRNDFQHLGPYGTLGQLHHRQLGIGRGEMQKQIDAHLRSSEKRLSRRLTNPRIELLTTLDAHTLKLMQTLEVVFPEDMRYTETHFRELMLYPDAYAIILYDGYEPIAFIVAYHFPDHPEHAVFLDVISVKPEYQREGIGTELIALAKTIAAERNYTAAIFYCKPRNAQGFDLVAYYQRLGATVLNYERDRVRMMFDLTAVVRNEAASASA